MNTPAAVDHPDLHPPTPSPLWYLTELHEMATRARGDKAFPTDDTANLVLMKIYDLQITIAGIHGGLVSPMVLRGSIAPPLPGTDPPAPPA